MDRQREIIEVLEEVPEENDEDGAGLHEQARQSDLVLLDQEPAWSTTNWPPLPDGWRCNHASVVVNHTHQEQNCTTSEAQTVVVLGGHYCQGPRGRFSRTITNSVLLLNLAERQRQWREGPRMNKEREYHAAIVCNGAIYVLGGDHQGELDDIERIGVQELLQHSSSTTASSISSSTQESHHWTTLNCRLSTGRQGCCAVAVHDRYVVIMGGCTRALVGGIYEWTWQDLASVDILDTSNHTVMEGPSMNIPRSRCASAVIGHRIFVLGGCKDNNYDVVIFDSVEYWDFEKPDDKDDAKEETASTTVMSSLSDGCWTTHSELVLSVPCTLHGAVALGSCLVVGINVPFLDRQIVQVLDTTHRHRAWNLPPIGNRRSGGTLVTVAHPQPLVAMIGGDGNPSCATLSIVDKNSWCFRQLLEQSQRIIDQYRLGLGPGISSTDH